MEPAVLAACDEAAAIPMPPTVDSRNVGSAAAKVFAVRVGVLVAGIGAPFYLPSANLSLTAPALAVGLSLRLQRHGGSGGWPASGWRRGGPPSRYEKGYHR